MNLHSLRQFATRSALLLSLGLGAGACDKALNVEPTTNISSDKGYSTKEDAAAGLLGCYDGLQNTNYYGASFPSDIDMVSNNIIEVGTYNTTYGLVSQNQISADNGEVATLWQSIYDTINRCNYLLQQSDNITDTAFPKLTTQAEARTIRALCYMNLLSLWGGTNAGYGYPNGAGVPLRLTPTTAIGDQTKPLARSSETDVATAIRADLDFAIANLAAGAGTRATKNAAQALRARFELRMRNYADALKYAQQVPASASLALASTTTPDAIWQLYFSATDQNLYAFYWFPSPGGRNEFDPSPGLIAAHPAGDLRLPINNSTATAGTTLKYTHTATRDDYFNIVRYAEVVLTIAEAAAQTGDLITATTNLNIIRKRAGLANSTATTAAALTTDILLQRRLELAYEGHYWIDLRRTNTVQSTLGTGSTTAPNAWDQAFRNLFPLPLRDINLAPGILTQNPGF
ncbi:MAG: RagB/SusD family nutrient uptake outer membrane protein [Janthinobacterium lividum]